MPKLAFSSRDLPQHLSNAARMAAWCEQFETRFGMTEIAPVSDMPFHGLFEAVPLNDLVVAKTHGSVSGLRRTKEAIVADGRSGPCLIVNLAPRPFQIVQGGREAVVETGCATVFSQGTAGRFNMLDQTNTITLCMSDAAVAAAVRNAEDRFLQPVRAALEPLRMLKSYTAMLMADEGPADPATAQLVSNHILDLVALALGGAREAGDIARLRGLRAGRLHAVLADINAGFAEPSFSIHIVAQKQRVSVRYLHDLLQESGTGFGERVLELRLQLAYKMLSHWQHGHRKVTDIAFTSGFNDVSYFNRCFRSRFGMTPSDARAATAVAKN